MNFSIVLYFFAGFLTLPTAYVTGNPVECVIHPEIWNKSKIWDPQAVGQIYEDQYEEEYVGYPIESVSTTPKPRFSKPLFRKYLELVNKLQLPSSYFTI